MGKRQQRPIPSVYELQWECGLLPLYTIQVNILYLLYTGRRRRAKRLVTARR